MDSFNQNISCVIFLLIGLNLSLGWKQVDVCEFQDGGERVDTDGVWVISMMHPRQTLSHLALYGSTLTRSGCTYKQCTHNSSRGSLPSSLIPLNSPSFVWKFSFQLGHIHFNDILKSPSDLGSVLASSTSHSEHCGLESIKKFPITHWTCSRFLEMSKTICSTTCSQLCDLQIHTRNNLHRMC